MPESAPKKTERKVFVLVPSYEHAEYVERCLRSIFAQTVSPAKLLVIDDGSGDGSPAIIERVLKECPFDSELIVRENRGLARTLNQALSLSFGEYFAYISSDDLWLPEFLNRRTKALDGRENAVLAYGPAYVIDRDDGIFDITSNWGRHIDGNATEMLLEPVFPPSAGVVYRRSVLLDEKWNESAALEDHDLYLRLSMRGDFAYDAEPLSAWRVHGKNTSGDAKRMLDEWLAAVDRNVERLGIADEELRTIRSRMRSNAIPMLARAGARRRAMIELFETAGGRSLRSILRDLVVILFPATGYAAWRYLRDSLRKRKYGKVSF